MGANGTQVTINFTPSNILFLVFTGKEYNGKWMTLEPQPKTNHHLAVSHNFSTHWTIPGDEASSDTTASFSTIAYYHHFTGYRPSDQALCISEESKSQLLLGGITSFYWLEYSHGYLASASSEGLLVYKRDTCYSMVPKRDGKGSLFYYSEIFAPYRLLPTEKERRTGLRHLVQG